MEIQVLQVRKGCQAPKGERGIKVKQETWVCRELRVTKEYQALLVLGFKGHLDEWGLKVYKDIRVSQETGADRGLLDQQD